MGRIAFISDPFLLSFCENYLERMVDSWNIESSSNRGFNPRTHKGCDDINIELPEVMVDSPLQLRITLRDKPQDLPTHLLLRKPYSFFNLSYISKATGHTVIASKTEYKL